MEHVERFKEIYRELVTRPGAADLLKWLEEETDFFTAPASTKYHGAYEGGLVEHSLNAYDWLTELEETGRLDEIADSANMSGAEMDETAAICALLHDVCKANYYAAGTSRKQNAAGQWETVPSYTVKDLFPFGHGEKSVLLIERFMRLTAEEALAIRWHMGAYDEAARGGSRTYSAALRFSPLVLELHIADMRAAQSEQREEEQ